MSSMRTTTPATLPPPGFVHLILFDRRSGREDEEDRSKDEDILYLEVPIDIAHAACLFPRKYLRYLGWCVLGLEGALVDENGIEVSLDGQLLERVDPEVINLEERSEDESGSVSSEYCGASDITASSQSKTTREDFISGLVARDGWCVWTGLKGRGMHIVPYRRGDEWLQFLVKNRPNSEDENLDVLSVSDIRNGICVDGGLYHYYFNPREAVVLKTPNPMLDSTDIPWREPFPYLDARCTLPTNARYTLQWLVQPTPPTLRVYPNNSDACFLDQALPKPASVLLGHG